MMTGIPGAGLNVLTAIGRMERHGAPAIVVPIHNAPGELEACIAALLEHTPGHCRIILMEDASLDPLVADVLARYEGRPNLEIHRNERNFGFTRSVNRGIEIAGRSDVVLLNSDTEVTPRWLQNLRLAACSGGNVATATPFSNNAGAFSTPAPGRDNPLPDWLGLNDYARLVTQASEHAYPAVPTGNGFCMYIRRDCIDRIGAFDAEAFPRGYGEENDFCMRAARDGWTHVIDDATLIYHVRSASFGAAREELMKRGRAVLDRRYPDYTGLVRGFEKIPELQRVRQRLGAAIAANQASRRPVKPRIMVVEASGGAVLNNPGWELFILRYVPGAMQLFAPAEGGQAGQLAASAALPPASEPMTGPDNPAEAIVANWLIYYAIERVRFSAVDGVTRGLRAICERLDIPVDPA